MTRQNEPATRRRSPAPLGTPPAVFTEAIFAGAAQIRAAERRKRTIARTAMAAVACLVLIFAGFALGRTWIQPAEDAVLTQNPSASTLSEVWAHPDDPRYHASTDCSLCRPSSVLMNRKTAEEFEKVPCEQCMGE